MNYAHDKQLSLLSLNITHDRTNGQLHGPDSVKATKVKYRPNGVNGSFRKKHTTHNTGGQDTVVFVRRDKLNRTEGKRWRAWKGFRGAQGGKS